MANWCCSSCAVRSFLSTSSLVARSTDTSSCFPLDSTAHPRGERNRARGGLPGRSPRSPQWSLNKGGNERRDLSFDDFAFGYQIHELLQHAFEGSPLLSYLSQVADDSSREGRGPKKRNAESRRDTTSDSLPPLLNPRPSHHAFHSSFIHLESLHPLFPLANRSTLETQARSLHQRPNRGQSRQAAG